MVHLALPISQTDSLPNMGFPDIAFKDGEDIKTAIRYDRF
jgi:hypothetical protein